MSVRRASGRGLVFLLAGLATLGPFSNDTVLPSFPAIGASFEITQLQLQQALTAYFAPFALMMLFHGSLSDAHGRRRVILAGVGLYAVAALVCATASSFSTFLAGRALMGASAGAGVVVGRAIVRDVYSDEQAQRALALVMIVFGVAPAFAPIIGGWLGHWFGWRSVFGFLGALASIFLAVSVAWLPETLPRSRRVPFSAASLVRGCARALTNPGFALLALAFGLNFAGFFVYIVSSPAFGYRILGIEQTEFVWIFGPSIVGLILGSWASGVAAGRLAPSATMAVCYVVMIGAALGNVAWHATHPASLPASIVPILVYNVGLGMAMPTLMLLALDLMPERRGLASALLGFSQSGFNALLAGALSPLVSDSAASLAASALALSCGGAVCWTLHLATRSGSEPRRSADA